MMQLWFDEVHDRCDLRRRSGLLVNKQSTIETACLLSLQTDASSYVFDGGGSEIDALIARGKITQTTLDAIKASAKKSLAWLLDDGVVTSLDVAVYQQSGVVYLDITTRRTPSSEPTYVTLSWEAYANGT